MGIDISKRYRTRDGRDVRIERVAGAKGWVVYGRIEGNEFQTVWGYDGGIDDQGRPHAMDLVEVSN